MRMLPLSLALGLVHPSGAAEPPRLYVFFSEKTPGASEALRAARTFLKKVGGEGELRPAFLVEDWKSFRKLDPDSPLYLAIRELGEGAPLQIFDEEALRFARAWKLTRLPAFVWVERGRAHLFQGSSRELEDLFQCTR